MMIMTQWLNGLTARRGESVDNDRVALGLIGSIWSKRTPNPAAFISTIKVVWSLKYGVEIVHIGRNLFNIQVFHWRDKKKILDGQPWHFDKYPLLLEEMSTAVKPSDLDIFYLPIWARFYDVPFRGRGNKENARVLGNKVGEFLEVAKPSGYSLEESLRVRVKIDVQRPLRDHIQLKVQEGQVLSIPVKYERLPMICFYCGRLGHGSNDCVEFSGDGTPEKKYEPSLRASPWKVFKEEEKEAGGSQGVDKVCPVMRGVFITEERDKERRRVDRKLVDEVADIFHKVSLDPKELGFEVGGNGASDNDGVDFGSHTQQVVLGERT